MTADVTIRDLHARYDRSDMLGLVSAFPRQMEQAWEIGREFATRLERLEVDHVVLCGMGGSAIGGDMLRSFFGNRLRVPIHSCRDYAVPAYLSGRGLVVISSYSGNTGETLSAFDSVRGANAAAAVIAVTSGGKVERVCAQDDIPCCIIPGGMPPRAAIAFSFFPTVQALRAVGVAEFDDDEYAEALSAVQKLCVEYSLDATHNRALDLAHALRGKVPFVYSGPGLFEAIARRWACQFNENSKVLAHFAFYPELNHNEIVGWEVLEELMGRVHVISLEDQDDHEMTRNQAEIGLGIVGPLAAGVERIDSSGGGRLTRLLSTMLLGDFASVYLALLGGVDPTPVKKIDYLKGELEKLSPLGPSQGKEAK